MGELRHEAHSSDPALLLASLWDRGESPDLLVFLRAFPGLDPSELATVVRVDQSRRWQRGERNFTEYYLAKFPEIRDDATSAVDLIHHEFLLRERLGPAPTVDEFTDRFSEHAATIRDQVAIHRAFASSVRRENSGAEGAEAVRWSRLDLLASLPAAASRFGRYTLVDILGHGGMGTVYRAYDDHLEREVALKILRAEADPDGRLTSRFLREAKIAATFTDPRLCPVHDVGVADGIHYFTMPLLSGETLAVRLKRDGAVSPDHAARLVATIARAVSIAHRAGVVHRDLKPANIMMTADDAPVVLDFGLARRQTAPDAHSTETGVVLGTPGYMAPEQIGGDSREVGLAADVYSLGVILYELLTGKLPFDGQSHEIMRKALTQSPVSPRSISPTIEPALEKICLTAMARDATDRFPSMDALADALESYLDGTFTMAPPAEPAKSKKPALLLLVLALLIGAAATGAYFTVFRSPSVAPPPIQASQRFPVGAEWSGRFVFRGRLSGYEGDVRLRIIASEGNSFRALYATEGGKFEWEVAGTERGDSVRWEFMRATRGTVNPSIVGKAHVQGSYRTEVLELIFTDVDSIADVVLTRSH
jgi:serine/threonine protein kinase